MVDIQKTNSAKMAKTTVEETWPYIEYWDFVFCNNNLQIFSSFHLSEFDTLFLLLNSRETQKRQDH